jgi:hypothetical protein
MRRNRPQLVRSVGCQDILVETQPLLLKPRTSSEAWPRFSNISTRDNVFLNKPSRAVHPTHVGSSPDQPGRFDPPTPRQRHLYEAPAQGYDGPRQPIARNKFLRSPVFAEVMSLQSHRHAGHRETRVESRSLRIGCLRFSNKGALIFLEACRRCIQSRIQTVFVPSKVTDNSATAR